MPISLQNYFLDITLKKEIIYRFTECKNAKCFNNSFQSEKINLKTTFDFFWVLINSLKTKKDNGSRFVKYNNCRNASKVIE